MNPFITAKLAVNIVSALGVSKIVGEIVKNNVTVITTGQKIIVNTGSFVLGSMLVEHACNHVNKTFDELVAMRKDVVEVIEEDETSV